MVSEGHYSITNKSNTASWIGMLVHKQVTEQGRIVYLWKSVQMTKPERQNLWKSVQREDHIHILLSWGASASDLSLRCAWFRSTFSKLVNVYKTIYSVRCTSNVFIRIETPSAKTKFWWDASFQNIKRLIYILLVLHMKRTQMMSQWIKDI